MKTKQAIIATLGLIGAVLLYSLAIYARLPEKMPIHWNIRGEVDGWADKKTAVLMIPGISIGIFALLLGLPAISPGKFSMERFRNTYNYIMFIIVGLMSYIHIIILQAALNPTMSMNKALMTGMFLFFALLGNMMGKVRRNLYVGVKTPWTLASDKVWDPTHRLAGRLMVGSALIGAALSFIGVSIAVSITLFVVAALYPILFSYLLFKKLESTGRL